MDMSKPRHSQHDAKLTQTHTVGGNIYTYAVVKHHEFHWIFFLFFHVRNTPMHTQCVELLIGYFICIFFSFLCSSSIRIRRKTRRLFNKTKCVRVCAFISSACYRRKLIFRYFGMPLACRMRYFRFSFWILNLSLSHRNARSRKYVMYYCNSTLRLAFITVVVLFANRFELNSK